MVDRFPAALSLSAPFACGTVSSRPVGTAMTTRHYCRSDLGDVQGVPCCTRVRTVQLLSLTYFCRPFRDLGRLGMKVGCFGRLGLSQPL